MTVEGLEATVSDSGVEKTEFDETGAVAAPETAPEKVEAAPEKTGFDALREKAAKVLAGKDTSKGVAPSAEKVVTEDKPVYTPNFKFKVLDKEQEIDEWARGIVKDPDTEKKVRELFEKAYGLDHVKQERTRYRDAAAQAEQQYGALSRGLDYLGQMIDKGDLNGFFKELKIPEEKVLQYALSRVQYKELPPEQRQKVDAEYQTQQRLEYFERANQELLGAFQQTQIQQRTNELDSFLGRQDVAQAAQVFDQRVGRAGAFRDEVVKRGQYYASLPQPMDIPVAQAVQEILSYVGPINPQAQAQGEIEEAAAPLAAPAQKPIIPNIKGRGTSPIKKAVRSIDDIRARAKEFNQG